MWDEGLFEYSLLPGKEQARAIRCLMTLPVRCNEGEGDCGCSVHAQPINGPTRRTMHGLALICTGRKGVADNELVHGRHA